MQTRQATGDISTGVITMLSKDKCAVSVNINGTPETLSFGKRVFYTWGNQCEGDMTNILEEDMEVNVCYKNSESQDTPSVLVVWIGDQPDLSDSVQRLVDVYNERGYVDDILDDGSFIVRADSTHNTVVVNKEVMYRDGCVLDVSRSPIAVDECLLFDAIPLEFPHASGAMYQATCAWIGKEPRLVDRFSLNVINWDEEKLEILTINRVYGTVVIPNDVVAFVEVEDAEQKIMLFRSSFEQSCERIQDIVNVGDKLCMRLCFAYIFGNCRQWFVARAWKSGEELPVTEENEDMWIIHPVAFAHHTATSAEDPKTAFVDVGSQQMPEIGNVTFDERSEVLYSDASLQGIFSFISQKRGLISFGNLWIKVKIIDIYTNGSLYNSEEFLAVRDDLGQIIVYFEAVLIYPKEKLHKGKKITHEATCVWIGQKPSLLTVAKRNVASCLFNRIDTYFGRVSKLYLPDIALVTLKQNKKGPTVYVHRNSFVTDSERSSGNRFITDFVKLDSTISFNVIHDPVSGFNLRAVNVRISAVGSRYKQVIESVSKNDRDNLQELLTGESNHSDESLDDVRKSAAVSFDATSKTLLRDPPLQGIIRSKKPKRGIGVIRYRGLNICVHLCDVYVKGRPCTTDQFCSLVGSEKVVNFEAILYCVSKCNIEFTHHATYVWVDEKPSLSVVASSLGKYDNSILSCEDRTVIGIVASFFLPDVALIRIGKSTKKGFKSVVCLHLSEFGCESGVLAECGDPESYCISDFVEFQGYYEFKVRKNTLCSLGQCAYNVGKSSKMALRVFNWMEMSKSEMTGSQTDGAETFDGTSAAVPFAPKCLLTKRCLLLNCLGCINVDSETRIVKIDHKFGVSILDTSVVYGLIGDAPLDDLTVLSCNNGEFRFDAEFVPSGEGCQICVRKIWLAAPEQITASKIISQKSVDFDPSTLYCGVITSTDLHNVAIAVVDEVSVLVTLDSIVTNKTDPSFSSVDIFFSVGDDVVLKVKEQSTSAGTYFKATACYKLKGNPIVPDGERQVAAWHELSWSSLWESGEYFRTGLVEERDGNYFVEFVSPKLPGTKTSLDLSRAVHTGKLFVDGKPTKTSSRLIGREISLHAACELQQAKGSKEMYIECAWVGDYPDLPLLLKHQTVAFRGLICREWYYEGIVADFPLPTHAICEVGILSVLLQLEPIKKRGEMVGFVESHLKRGDKVVLKIKEQTCSKWTLLVSSLCTSVEKLYDEIEVFKVVRGKVIKRPCPMGKIKMDGAPIEVWFDRSSVLYINGIFKNRSIFGWNKFIDNAIGVGTDVYFSAAKDLTLKNEYRACG